MHILNKYWLYGLLVCMLPFLSHADNTAKLLYEKNAPLVFQVKIIDLASGNKNTIGSGFQVSENGLVATNYHVVSGFVKDREKHAIEVLDHQNRTMEAALVDFDIVHDLALLQVNSLEQKTLQLSEQPLSHGNRIYSMGNPNDLGMTIIEGTYNGLVEASRYRKYLFSGSLNPGMSGGPVFNAAGEVIGINVSKGGEQISFLVPAVHLEDLMQQANVQLDPEQYKTRARDLLLNDQADYYNSLVSMQWPTRDFQRFELPDKVHASLKCWGHSMQTDKILYDEYHRHCHTEDQIFLDSNFFTGAFSFSYESITSDILNSSQFYHLLTQNYVMDTFSNSNDKKDTTNIDCTTEFVELDSDETRIHAPWKVTTCTRAYIEYEGLYDAGLIAMHADSREDTHEALLIKLYTTGIDKQNIARLHEKFLNSIQWKQ